MKEHVMILMERGMTFGEAVGFIMTVGEKCWKGGQENDMRHNKNWLSFTEWLKRQF